MGLVLLLSYRRPPPPPQRAVGLFRNWHLLLLVVLLLYIGPIIFVLTEGWTPPTTATTRTTKKTIILQQTSCERQSISTTTTTTADDILSNKHDTGTNRRKVLNYMSMILSSVSISSSAMILVRPGEVNAASTAATATIDTELQQRLPLGHARVKYLLDHWDEITSVCGTSVMSDIERKQVVRTGGGGGSSGSSNTDTSCMKTPLRVQEFMGYKSTKDPLYKIDKLLIRAGSFVTDDATNNSNNDESYLDLVEQYRSTADATALLAYTSSWGEANPNGSKDAIDDYLDQTKAQVVVSEQLLRKMLTYLNLQPLPPLQGKL